MRLTLLLITGLAATMANAQTGQAPASAPAPAPAGAPAAGARTGLQALIAADANKDGKWSKAEWLAAGRREMGFNFIDSDADGFVTRAELNAGVDRAKAMGLPVR